MNVKANASPISYSQIDYSIRCMFPKWSDWNIQYTRKGLIKRRISQLVRTVALLTAILGAYYIRKDVRGGLRAMSAFVRQNIRIALFAVLDLAQKGVSMLPE